MPYCPSCKYEFQPSVIVCPDCEVLLLDKRPNEFSAAITPDNSWVQICGVRSPSKAEMAKGALDSSNIPSVIMSSEFNDQNRLTAFQGEMPGFEAETSIILVPREFRDEAEFVVESVLGEDFLPMELE